MSAEAACPLCGLVLSDRDDVHRHLMVSHRKSTLSERLIEAATTEAESEATPVGEAP